MDRRHFIQIIGGSLCPTLCGAADSALPDSSRAKATRDQSDGERRLTWVYYRVSARGRVCPSTLRADAGVADAISVSKLGDPKSPAERLIRHLPAEEIVRRLPADVEVLVNVLRGGYETYRDQLALARECRSKGVLVATMTHDRSEGVGLADFDLDRMDFGFGDGETIRLQAIFTNEAAEYLQESPLSADQKLIPLQRGRTKVVATVPYNRQLEWWLLAFGERLEVLAPAKLRKRVSQTAIGMVRNYR